MKILPFNKCLKKNNFEFFVVNSTTSTMDEAKIKINTFNKNLIILAEEQTEGRGRRGNKWKSPSGNIYCSIALLLNIINIDFFKYAMLSCVAVKHSLEHIGLTGIYFKWPNDIYCQNKKISGVIQETFLNKFNKQILIIGVGINYLSSPIETKYKTTHITEYIDNISLKKYFEIYINYFLHYFDNFYSKNNVFFIQEFKKYQMFLNTNIRVKLNESKIIKGKFMGIKDDGSLILMEEKKESFIYSGQILI